METMETMETMDNMYYLTHKSERINYQTNYNEKNKDKIKEYQKQYYLKTKETKLKTQAIHNSKKIECACGVIHNQSNKTSHMRTKKHKRYIEETHYREERKESREEMAM